MTRALSLAETLLALLSPDGPPIGTQTLLQKFIAAGTAEGHRAAEADFEQLKEELLATGVLVKGKGRGGSLRRATAEAGGFDLAVQAAPAVDGEKVRKATVTAARQRSAPAADNAQIISYRHADKRKNNPEVGMIKPYGCVALTKLDGKLVMMFGCSCVSLSDAVDERDAVSKGNHSGMRTLVRGVCVELSEP